MKIIKDDVDFIAKEFVKIGLTATVSDLRRCGQECFMLDHDDSDDTFLCRFRDDERSWFPKSCVVEFEQEETTPENTEPKTLRDEIAIAAMESLLFSGIAEAVKIDEVKLAETSYKISDAMMEARKK